MPGENLVVPNNRWVDAALILCLAASLSGNILLGLRLKAYSGNHSGSEAAEASVGTIISGLKVVDLNGEPQNIDFLGDRTAVLYVFRPGCHWCDLNLGKIRALAADRKDSFRFVGISTTPEGLPSYLATHSLPFPVYVATDSTQLAKLDIIATPQTIEIASDGRIARNWVGTIAYQPNSAIERRFAVSLPTPLSR